jgi:hypothetical protein
MRGLWLGAFQFPGSAIARGGGWLSFQVSCDGIYQKWQVKFFRENGSIPAAKMQLMSVPALAVPRRRDGRPGMRFALCFSCS